MIASIWTPPKKGRTYSKGNRQKVAIVAALACDAQLLTARAARTFRCVTRTVDHPPPAWFYQLMLISERFDGLTLFGEELRTRIVGLLAEEQMCTCHLVEEIGVPQPTISYHLKLLRQAGIIDAEASGRFTYYQLVPEALADMAAELRELAVKARRATKVRRPCR